MAHVPAGTRVETQITISDATIRTYPYQFPVASADDVAVELNGVEVPPQQYVVTTNPGLTGGVVRFPDVPDVSLPVVLAVNDNLHIYRDTEVRRRTSFGTGGYAGAPAVEVLAAYMNRVLEELAARTETHERVIAGRDEIEGIAQRLIAQAQAGEGGLFSIGLDDLNTALRTLVNRFSLADQVELDGTTLTFYTAEGQPSHVELEDLTRGISIEDEHDTLISGFRAVKTIKASGNSADGGPYFTVDGDTATLHVAGLSAGGGQPSSTTTQHDLNPLEIAETPLATAVNIATTTVGSWTNWQTLLTSSAVAAADVGPVSVEAVLRGNVTSDTTGGGDRIYVESRLVRHEAASGNDVPIDWNIIYIRNGGNFGSQALEDASQMVEKSYSVWDEAAEGDTYKVEIRVISQGNLHTVQLTTDSMLQVVTGANVAQITTTDTTGGGGSTITPRTDQEIETLINANEKVLRGEALDTTLRGMVALATNASVQVVQSPSAYRIGPLNAHVRVPTDTGDYEIEVRVGTGAWQRWDLATLLALPAINQSDMLDDSNSLSWTEGGTTYRIAHDNQGFFGFTSDIGTYSVSIRGLPILLRAGMLPDASATESGIIGNADWQKIQDAVNAGVFDLPAAITNAGLDDSDRILVSDLSENTGSRLKGLPISELDARYQAAGQAGAATPNAVELDTSQFTSSDAGSFPAWDGASAWEEAAFATSDIEWMYANGEWTANGFRTLAALPIGSVRDNMPAGTLRFLRDHGIYELQPDSGGSATLEVAGWVPAADADNTNYGWDSDAARTFGTIPPGMVQGVVDASGAVTTPGFISLFRDSSNRIWLEATEGYFSQSGMVVTPDSGSPWHLAYNETTDGVDQFFSGTSTAAPWTTTAVSLSIHALGGVTPFTSGGKHWTLVSPIPRPLPAWLEADTPRPALQPPVSETLPFPLTTGNRYITTQVSREQPVFDVTLTAGGTNDPIRTTFQVPDSGAWTLIRYSAALTLAAAVRSQLVLDKPSAEMRTPLAIWIGSTRYNLGSELSGAHDNQFVIQAAPSTAVGDDLEIVLVFSANPHENEPAEVDIQPGDWTATGPYAVVGTPGTAAPWAQAGQPRPRLALDTLLDGTGAGVSTTNTGGANVQTNLEIFSPAFDLDDSDNQNGLVFVEVTARLHSKSDALISFGASAATSADVVDEMRIRGWVSLADIRGLGDYTASGTANALRAGMQLNVYLSGGIIARVRYYLAHNTDNELGRFKLINNQSGTSSFSVSFHELVFVEANEAGGAGGGIQIATDSEAEAGTITTKAVSPKQVSDRLDGHKIEVLTTAQYNALVTKDANTIYIAT